MKNSILRKLTGPAVAGVALSIAPVAFSSVLTWYTVVHEQTVVSFGFIQWLILTAVCCMTSALALTPPTFLALVFGYFLGWNALLPLFALNMGAILLVYMVVHRFDKTRFVQVVAQNSKARAVLEQLRARELPVIFFTKLSPVLPFALTNLVFALSGAQLRNILLGGFLGMVPRTALAVWTGRQGREIRTLLENPNQGNSTKVVIGVLILVSIIGLFAVLRPILAKQNQPRF